MGVLPRYRLLAPYVWISPAAVFFVLFVLYPVLFSTYLSVVKWNGFQPLEQAQLVGLANYLKLFTDPIFRVALINTFIFVGGTLLLQKAVGLSAAVALNFGRVPGRNLWRPLIFFPAVLSMVVVALVWERILSPTGPVNDVLSALGLGIFETQWLVDPKIVAWMPVLVNVWQQSGMAARPACISSCDPGRSVTLLNGIWPRRREAP